MAPASKKWVFNELVQDPDDPVQLIAYSMYKAVKNEHAVACQKRGMTETQVQTELERFHDSVAYSTMQLTDYTEKAKRAIEELVKSVDAQTSARFQQQLTTAEEEAKVNWANKVSAYNASVNPPGIIEKFCSSITKWLLGGIAGVFGTAAAGMLIVGIVSVFMPNAREVVRSGLKQAVDVILPSSPTGLDFSGKTDGAQPSVSSSTNLTN